MTCSKRSVVYTCDTRHIHFLVFLILTDFCSFGFLSLFEVFTAPCYAERGIATAIRP